MDLKQKTYGTRTLARFLIKKIRVLNNRPVIAIFLRENSIFPMIAVLSVILYVKLMPERKHRKWNCISPNAITKSSTSVIFKNPIAIFCLIK